MLKSEQIINLIDTFEGREPTEDELKRFRKAASKMVDVIEERRNAGDYTVDERSSLEEVFYDNMIKMVRGEIDRD